MIKDKTQGLGYLLGELDEKEPTEFELEIKRYLNTPQKPTPQPATDLSNFLNSTSIELPKSDFKIKKRRETLEQILTEKSLLDVPLSEFGKRTRQEIRRKLNNGDYDRIRAERRQQLENKRTLAHVNDTLELYNSEEEKK